MKLTCKRESILSAFQMASAAMPSKNIMPMLRNIHIAADADGCTLTATDLEVGIRARLVGLEVREPGDAIIPAERAIAILRESDASDVIVDADMVRTVVVAGGRFEIPGDDPIKFPAFPAADADGFEIASGVLVEMIRRTSFSAASAEHSRFGATVGVAWEIDGDRLTLVATDGRTLAASSGPCKGGGKRLPTPPVVPVKALRLIERGLGDGGDEPVQILIRPNDMIATTDRITIYSRLIEGRFPAWRQVVPKPEIHFDVVAGAFLRAVRQAAIMTDDESKGVDFMFGADKATMRACGAKSGKSEVEMPLANGPKNPISIRFDPFHLVDFLKIVGPETVIDVGLIDANAPALMTVGDDYRYVVVPQANPATSGGK